MSLNPWGNDIQSNAISHDDFARFELDVISCMISLGFAVLLVPGRRKITCLATNKHALTFDPYGLIHKCTETPLVAAYKMPTRRSLTVLSNSDTVQSNLYAVDSLDSSVEFGGQGLKLARFADEVRQVTVPCANCPMLSVCGGGCPLSWEQQGHVPCPSTKANIEGRLLLAYAEIKKKQAEACAA